MCRPNKALHLNEFKRLKVAFGCSLEHITFWERKKGENGERARAWEKIKLWCDSFPLFSSKRSRNLQDNDLKRFKVRKQKPNFTFYDFDFGGNALT